MKKKISKQAVGLGALSYLVASGVSATIKEVLKDLLVLTGMDVNLYG